MSHELAKIGRIIHAQLMSTAVNMMVSLNSYSISLCNVRYLPCSPYAREGLLRILT